MDMVTDSLSARQQEFQKWVRTVRDPAEQASEGLRTLETQNRQAIAEYEVAQISTEQWAVRINLVYRCGDHHGVGFPWTALPSREECVEFFLQTARRHFQRPKQPFGAEAQRTAQREMSELLTDGLFAFCEPVPSVRV